MKKTIIYLNILVFILLLVATKIEAVEVSAFEQTYFRNTGAPVTETNTFHKINGLAKIRVTNGSLEDAAYEMVSSSIITLNGEVIINSSNFNQNVGVIEVERNLSGGINTIEVVLKGKPGGALTVQVLAETGDIDFDDDNFTGNEGDCNDDDNDSNEHPNQTWYNDVDGDGYSDGTTDTASCTRPAGYKTVSELTATSVDCSDNDDTINPGVQEVCDGIDNNCDGQIDEPVIIFISPVDDSTINLSSTLVTGTIYTCSQEVGIVVNGVLAMSAGNEFAVNDVPLEIGVNTLTAVATDEEGKTATNIITVYTNVYQDQVNISANITSGISSLDVTFSIDTQISNPIVTYEMDFEGDGVIDQTITDPDNVPFTYVQEGLYYPTITVTDDQGYWYTDTIAINVLSLNEMDVRFNTKWNGMKSALINGDIEGALEFFDEAFRELYRKKFTALSSILDTIGNGLGYLRLVDIQDNSAELEIIVTRDGDTYSYYLLIVRDKDGLWKTRAF